MKFEDCIKQLNTGLNPRTNFTLGEGELKYITAKNLTKYGTIDFSKCDFINEEAKRIIHKRSDIRTGDILFSSRAPIGHCHLIKSDPFFYDIGESIFSIRVNREVVLPEYMCLYLASDYFVKYASKHVTGSIIMEIRIGDLMNTEIIVPPLEIQKRIAKNLNSIDAKMEFNEKINDNLQQMVKTIYDYWFTQFDFPNEDGKPYRSSGGQMVWNEQLKREIPVGWSVGSIVDNPLSSVIKPGVDCFEHKEYLATADVNGTNISTGNIVAFATRENRANMQPRVNSVWFAKMKNSVKHLFLNAEMDSFIKSTILSTGFCGIQCTEQSFEFISSLIETKYFETVKDILAHGATQEAVNNDDMESIKFAVPTDEVLENYHKVTKGVYAQISKNICENRNLVSLRDWLLPMLMNGQATVEG